MNEDFSDNNSMDPMSIDPASISTELQVRLMNLVMDEASDFERDQLQLLMEQRPEVAAYYQHLEHLHGLLSEVGAGDPLIDVDPSTEDVAWQLSADRRAKVLAVIDNQSPGHVDNVTLAKKTESKRWRMSTVYFTAIALTACVLVALMLPAVNLARRQRWAIGAKMSGGTDAVYQLDAAPDDFSAVTQSPSQQMSDVAQKPGAASAGLPSLSSSEPDTAVYAGQSLAVPNVLAVEEDVVKVAEIPPGMVSRNLGAALGRALRSSTQANAATADGRQDNSQQSNNNFADDDASRQRAAAFQQMRESGMFDGGGRGGFSVAGNSQPSALPTEPANKGAANKGLATGAGLQASNTTAKKSNDYEQAEYNDLYYAAPQSGERLYDADSDGSLNAANIGSAIPAKPSSQWNDDGIANSRSSEVVSPRPEVTTWEIDSDMDGVSDSKWIDVPMVSSLAAEQSFTVKVPEDALAFTEGGGKILHGGMLKTSESVDGKESQGKNASGTGSKREDDRFGINLNGAVESNARSSNEQQVASLVETYNDLMDKRSYAEAEVVAKQVASIDPNSLTSRVLSANASNARNLDYEKSKMSKEEGFIAALNDVDRAATPITDGELQSSSTAKSWTELGNRRMDRSDPSAEAGKSQPNTADFDAPMDIRRRTVDPDSWPATRSIVAELEPDVTANFGGSKNDLDASKDVAPEIVKQQLEGLSQTDKPKSGSYAESSSKDGLFGDVPIEFIEPIDVVIIRGSQRDVERTLEVVEQSQSSTANKESRKKSGQQSSESKGKQSDSSEKPGAQNFLKRQSDQKSVESANGPAANIPSLTTDLDLKLSQGSVGSAVPPFGNFDPAPGSSSAEGKGSEGKGAEEVEQKSLTAGSQGIEAKSGLVDSLSFRWAPSGTNEMQLGKSVQAGQGTKDSKQELGTQPTDLSAYDARVRVSSESAPGKDGKPIVAGVELFAENPAGEGARSWMLTPAPSPEVVAGAGGRANVADKVKKSDESSTPQAGSGNKADSGNKEQKSADRLQRLKSMAGYGEHTKEEIEALATEMERDPRSGNAEKQLAEQLKLFAKNEKGDQLKLPEILTDKLRTRNEEIDRTRNVESNREKAIDEQSASSEAFSTFSLHVSDVAFKLAQTVLSQGQWPDASKIRIEEFVNAIDYHDPLPTGNQKVACRVEQAIHPFLMQRNLLRVSMRTAATGRAQNTPLRLTLLLDNSGSMERPDRRQAVLRAFQTLTQQLKVTDQITLISFASTPRLLADKVAGNQGETLLQLIENLPSEGGTNIEAALMLAREKAAEQQVAGAQNRIVLLTDGAVNLGNANPESLAKLVIQMRDAGIAFDAAGISAQDLNDEVLEALTRQGDGRYYLLDSAEAVGASFAAQIAGALRPSAQNVKVQVEFNPQRVGRYKLLGFEKHRLNKEDFRNDKVDAAEMAAAEAGVAVYQFEIKPNGSGDVGSVSVRFRDLSSGKMVENRWPIPYESNTPRLEQAEPSMQLAASAALFAAKLSGGPLGDSVDLTLLQKLLAKLPEQCISQPRVQQLRTMIEQAISIGR